MDSLHNKLARKGYSVVANCIRNMETLEDDNILFVAKRPDINKWKIMVKKPYISDLGVFDTNKDDKIQYYEVKGVNKELKSIDLMEYRA